jgi:formylglycine-generating enzyme required for sulfatase activity/pimeloyl-ACP methyl ester carboxylesterase
LALNLDAFTAALGSRYTLHEELGRGGMAVVYRATDLKHDRPVAIKVLKPDIAASLGPERFLREIKLTARLNHPHILPLLDSGEAAGYLYYVMPYVAGESLRARLDREQRLPLEDALRIGREVAEALDSAHRQGVLHRDIKPENILLEEGHAVVADFGIARAIAKASDDHLTTSGVVVGTPAYMSPEQMTGGEDLDQRSDVYALACVVYELLAGEPPFQGPTVQAIMTRRFKQPPPRISRIRADVPAVVDEALRRGLAQAPEQRHPSAAQFAVALAPAHARSSETDLGALARLGRRPAVAIPALAVVLALAAAIVIPQRGRASRHRAREMVARAAALTDSARYAEAYDLLTRAERVVPEDSGIGRLWPKVGDLLSVTSEPAGAQVFVREFDSNSQERADSILLGTTPLAETRLARGDYVVTLVKDGFVPFQALATRNSARGRRPNPQRMPATRVTAMLWRADSAPRDMVFVPGGGYRLVGPALPLGLEARLDDYFIDRYEVSNEAYKQFIGAGGYQRAEYWPDRRRPDGKFVDRTGMAGPRSWLGQEYPAGRGRYPVTDVSWDEAAAFCAFSGKRLPTIFQWEKAARNGLTATGEGVIMPWGYVAPGDATSGRANFGGSGPAPVDAYPFGMSPFGAYNMAGNVKEWTANPLGTGYGVTGGSWADPIYLYPAYGALARAASAPTLGFRCAKALGRAGQGDVRFRLDLRTPQYTPVAASAFPALLAHYRYDRRPLDARIIETVETPDWVREKIRYVALEGDTALAYLYLPRLASRPLETMVYVASSGAFAQVRTVPEELEWAVGSNVKAGRAALAIVFRGMAERGFGPEWEPPAPNSVRFRDLMVLHATEMRRGMDYLATRDDIDMQRLAYVAVSWGAGSRLPFAAIDDRFRAVVLIGGGIDERIQPTLPEAANYNFAPYIRAPVLLLNGRDDEEHPWFTRALPLWNLLPQPKKLVLVDGGGHVPPLEARVPAVNQFLDQTLGPVVRLH